MDNITRNDHIKCIDAVKGFTITLVIFCHAGGIPYVGVALFASFMQVFFVLAGITYNDKVGETLRSYLIKRAKRLLIPYATWSVLLLLIDAFFEKLTVSEIMRGGIGIIYARYCLLEYHGDAGNILLLNNLNGPLWFLPAMFISSLLFWLIVKAKEERRPLIIVGYITVNMEFRYSICY